MTATPEDFEDDTQAIHASAIVIDGHADTPQRFLDESWDFTDPPGQGMLSLETARQGGLEAEFFAIWAEPVEWKGHYAHRSLALIDALLEQVRRHPADLQLCCSPHELVAAHAAGKFAVLIGIEGGHSIENDLGLLRTYYRLGARYMTLTWSNSNEWANSSGDLDDPAVTHHQGLTDFGHEVVREMNRLGMMVDVSHVSDATLAAVLVVTQAPVIASHSGAYALTRSHRNLTDDQLRAIATTDGLIMVNFFPAFIDERWRNEWDAQAEERHAAHALLQVRHRASGTPIPYAASNAIDRSFANRLERAPLASLIDHLDHIAAIAGIDHVGIGTDFDGIPSLPEGIDSAADLPKVTAALRSRGYPAEQLRKILGGNLLRVFREVQEAGQAAAPSGQPGFSID